MKTTVALAVGSFTAGGLAGYGLGVAWLVSPLQPMGASMAGTLLLAACALDVIAARSPRWKPLAVRSQVPREWTTLLPLPTAAALYGARLGVGPLTLLPTWVWWAAALIAASLGVAASVAVGILFGVVRAATIIVASAVVQEAMAVRMARLQKVAPAAALGLGAVVAGSGLLALAG